MSFEKSASAGLNYYPCHYGKSRLVCRGPARSVPEPYVACLGSTETFGKFLEAPWPTLLERRLKMPCLNLGGVNAGVDSYLSDLDLQKIAQKAAHIVVQVMGAQNLCNAYYSVHPRRNDRFLDATDALRQLYPEVDFMEYHFTRHLLQALRAISRKRFEAVVIELKAQWVRTMRDLLAALDRPVTLVWFAGHLPADPGDTRMRRDPLFVDRDMLGALDARDVVYARPSADAILDGLAGLKFTPLERSMAEELLGPRAHVEAARALELSLGR